MKVFVVTSGSYSDYRIDGIFSTKKKAEAYIASIPDDRRDTNGVDEWDVDGKCGMVWKPHFRTTVNLATGDVEQAWECSDGLQAAGDRGTAELSSDGVRAIGISYVSQEHATKLAVEKRQEWLRTNSKGKAPR